MVRVALYTRVSTEDQAKEGFSLDAQLERLRYFAKAQGWEVADAYVDEGHSGRTTRRPQYQRMMAERDRWDTLLVMKMDRIHRNSRNFMAMMDELRRDGKEFASVTESLDTSTAMGRFVMDIIQRIAQLESEQIGERVFVGMEQKARSKGGTMGKPAPFGYAYQEGRLAPVAAERPWVEGMFSRFLEGFGTTAIASWLNENLVLTREEALWDYRAVRRILQNPTYKGTLRWEGVDQDGQHEAIVGAEAFGRVQELLARRSSGGLSAPAPPAPPMPTA